MNPSNNTPCHISRLPSLALKAVVIALAISALWPCMQSKAACSHKYGGWVVTKEATCTAKGKKKRTCSKCGNVETKSIPKTEHSYGSYKVTVKATCVSTGTKERTCKVCSHVDTATVKINKNNHVNTKWKVTKKATCVKGGTKEQQCLDCGAVLDTKATDINPDNHKWSLTKEKTPTCIAAGYKKYTCDLCNTTKKETVAIDSTAHDWDEWVTVTEATCDTDGLKKHECKLCHKVKQKKTEAGHDWRTIRRKQEADCGHKSLDLQECRRCKTVRELEGDFDYSVHNCYKYSTPADAPYTCLGEYDLYLIPCFCKATFVSVLRPCTCHTCSYHLVSVGEHTAKGHRRYYECSCGNWKYGSYTKLDSCPACTNSSEVYPVSIKNGSFYKDGTEAVIFYVRDNENDTLTCKWCIDGGAFIDSIEVDATKNGREVTFPTLLDFDKLTEGEHTLKIVADDPIAPDGISATTFVVDRSSPDIEKVIVSKDTTSATISAVASDTLSGMAEYRYTLDGIQGEWISSASVTYDNLTPLSAHTYLVEVKDNAGNITEESESFRTSPEIPMVYFKIQDKKHLLVMIDDSNPSDTIYEVRVSCQDDGRIYREASGPDSKSILIEDLDYDTNYSVIVRALGDNDEYSESEEFSVKTGKRLKVSEGPLAPSPKAEPDGMTRILITWNSVKDAASYELEIDGTVYNVGSDTSYVHEGLELGSIHEYRVRARNSLAKGKFSESVAASTNRPLPSVPEIIEVFKSEDGGKVSFTWTPSENASYYEIEADGSIVGTVKSNRFSLNLVSDSHMAMPEKVTVRLRAANESGFSEWSERFSVDISTVSEKEVLLCPPAVPEVTVKRTGITYAIITWNRDNDADYYTISIPGKEELETSASEAGLTGLAPDHEYPVTVTAHAGEYSSESTVTVRTAKENTLSGYTDRKVELPERVYGGAGLDREFTLTVPIRNVKKGSRYSFEIAFNDYDAELTDLYSVTKRKEMKELTLASGQHLTVSHEDHMYRIRVVCEVKKNAKKYMAASFKFRAMSDEDCCFIITQ